MNLLSPQSQTSLDGRLMIKTARIRNFRCFEEVELRNCTAINVIVGDNASGKTALMEALFLSLGASPEVATRYRGWRGYDALTGSRQDIDVGIWRDLFFQFDMSREIEVEISGSGTHNRGVVASYGAETQVRPDLPLPIANQLFLSPMKFVYLQGGRRIEVPIALIGNEYQFINAEPLPTEGMFFASNMPYSAKEMVDRFSKVSRLRLEDPIVEIMSREFGFISTLEILSHYGVPMLHADSPWFGEKVPINALSTGVTRLAAYLIGAASMPNGVLFIDEIENGMHYLRYPKLWSALRDVCADHGVQLFASTHSRECLEALAAAFSKEPDSVNLIRTSMTGKKSEVQQFRGASFLKGLRMGEIR